MSKSESIANLAAALVKAQSEFPAIPRNKQVTVTGQKGSYKFFYAPFEDILRAVRPALNSNGLGFTQSAAGDRLSTVILHKSGEWMVHEVGIVNPSGTAQSYGSALTYSRRYGFCTAFGIQADDDDDANAADGNTVTHQEHKAKDERNPLTAMKEDAFNSMPKDEQEFLRKVAANITSLIGEGRTAEAHGYYVNQKLDDEEKLALWFLLGSKERASLKKEDAQAELERRAAERNKHQQSRPSQQVPQ